MTGWSKNDAQGRYPDGQYWASFTLIRFCCQTKGIKNYPILLPSLRFTSYPLSQLNVRWSSGQFQVWSGYYITVQQIGEIKIAHKGLTLTTPENDTLLFTTVTIGVTKFSPTPKVRISKSPWLLTWAPKTHFPKDTFSNKTYFDNFDEKIPVCKNWWSG